MPLASTLYKEMLVANAPRGTTIEFETLFPCTEEYAAPTDDELAAFDAFGAAFLLAEGVSRPLTGSPSRAARTRRTRPTRTSSARSTS
jgi:hypothetical protein